MQALIRYYGKYMTNFFQCYDVPLAANDNFITLCVTDLAGNTATTNFDVVLDYTTTAGLRIHRWRI